MASLLDVRCHEEIRYDPLPFWLKRFVVQARNLIAFDLKNCHGDEGDEEGDAQGNEGQEGRRRSEAHEEEARDEGHEGQKEVSVNPLGPIEEFGRSPKSV